MRTRLKSYKLYGQFSLCLSGILFFVQSCGVVADPIPPEDIGIEAKILAQKKAEEEKFREAGEKFKEAEEAYYVLSNAKTRKLYDMEKIQAQKKAKAEEKFKEAEGEQTQNNKKPLMTKRDYYEVLGTSPDASGDEIEKAFRNISRQHYLDLQTYPTVTLGEESIPLPPLQPVISQ